MALVMRNSSVVKHLLASPEAVPARERLAYSSECGRR